MTVGLKSQAPSRETRVGVLQPFQGMMVGLNDKRLAEQVHTKYMCSQFDGEALLLDSRVALFARKQFSAVVRHGALSAVVVTLAEHNSYTTVRSVGFGE